MRIAIKILSLIIELFQLNEIVFFLKIACLFCFQFAKKCEKFLKNNNEKVIFFDRLSNNLQIFTFWMKHDF